ncbi:FUSC family protein [Aliidongia dinghuensis]|uniref:FUSC family protein n=1 Tax=Aliidongia dinghuensis TaxID=1867774 RepID=A0A8J2YQ18_9PROT|nr:FUSC family protein [Aliidongia dinghuensis]GGF02998.1 FUSC family protein [Aliidongia dinghuensis]
MGDRWGQLVGWLKAHPTEFRLGLRMLVAGMAAFFVADVLLNLPQSYWAVLTAVIIMQASLGGALKASVDRIVGTILGALWGVIVGFIVPHGGSWLLATTMLATLAPLSLLVAFRPAYRIAPATAIIVLLGSSSQEAGPFLPALHRVLEIIIGSLVGLAVALLVLPARAHRLLADQSSTVLSVLAEQIGELPPRLAGRADAAAWQRIADRRRKAQEKAETLADEAKRERRNRLADTPDPEPLTRTLRRLGIDMAQIGRATNEPWDTSLGDASLAERLAVPVANVATATGTFLTDCGRSLTTRRPPPSSEALSDAIDRYAEAVATLRREGLTRPLAGPAIERLFGLGFALDQLRRDAEDLAERIAELAPPSEPEMPADEAAPAAQ